MQMPTHAKRLKYVCQQLLSVADDLEQNPTQCFGYRERVLVERPIFLVVKEVCWQRLGHDLHGMSTQHRKRLDDIVKNEVTDTRLTNFICEAFELRIFVLDLSSGNPYVQGDALSRASLVKHDTVKALTQSLRRLARKAMNK